MKTPSKNRRNAFLVVVALFTALFLAIAGPLLPYAVTGWFPSTDLADHRLHEVVIMSALVLVLLGVVFQFFGPGERPAALAQSLGLVLVIFLVRAASGDVFPPLLIFAGLLGVAAFLHPYRRAVVKPWLNPRPWLAAVAVVGLFAAVPYALDQSALQREAPAEDEHAEAGHWSTMAAVALGAPVLALMAAGGAQGWRVPGVSAALLGGVLGGVSLAYPGQPSALPAWAAGSALAWAVAVVALAFASPARAGGDVTVPEGG